MPVALTAKILFHSSRVVSRNGTGEVIPAMFSTAPTVGRLGGVHRVPGGQHGLLVGDVDGAAEGRHAVPLGQLGGQLLRGVAVQVQAGDGPAVPGEPVGGGPADAALGSDSGDDDGALRAAVMGFLLRRPAAGGGAKAVDRVRG